MEQLNLWDWIPGCIVDLLYLAEPEITYFRTLILALSWTKHCKSIYFRKIMTTRSGHLGFFEYCRFLLNDKNVHLRV